MTNLGICGITADRNACAAGISRAAFRGCCFFFDIIGFCSLLIGDSAGRGCCYLVIDRLRGLLIGHSARSGSGFPDIVSLCGLVLHKESINSDKLIDFMRRLIHDSEKKVFLILDNLKAHHSNKVKEWVEKHKDEIEIFFLPPYAPEYNPDEYLNSDLKRCSMIIRNLLLADQ